MTIKRLIARNGLGDGDYGTVPQALFHQSPVTVRSVSDEWIRAQYFESEHQAQETAKAWNSRLAMLAGDLRRLERDTLDENAIAKAISLRTGIDPDDVAAVLQAWWDA